MKILIISDSHGRTDNIELIKHKIGKIDMIIHCGDGASDYDFISDYFKCRLNGVAGNCDMFTREPQVLNLNIEGKIVHVEHGNRLPVFDENNIIRYARDNGYSVILYGHTHVQKIVYEDGIWVVNPGSISRPRDGMPSYCIMSTDGKGGFNFVGERV